MDHYGIQNLSYIMQQIRQKKFLAQLKSPARIVIFRCRQKKIAEKSCENKVCVCENVFFRRSCGPKGQLYD